MKNEIVRRSPVAFGTRTAKEEKRGDWNVALAYENESDGPHLVDLSHCTRWDLQDGDIGKYKPLGLTIPEKPGHCAIENQVIINRMNNTQAAIWHIGGGAVKLPQERAYTDVTEVSVFLAIIGANVFSITEQLTPLDLSNPAKKTPHLVQGPFAHVPCQIVVANSNDKSPGILLTCSRGYAHDMVKAVLEAGKSHGLRPAGESAFSQWIKVNNRSE